MAYNNNNLSDPRRREMLLRAVSGEPVLALSREYAVSRTRIYEALERIKRDPEGDLIDAEIQVEFWERVITILSRKPILQMPDLDALTHVLETNPEGDLPSGPHYVYERTLKGGQVYYEAYTLMVEDERLEYIGVVNA